jgi:hypothetical protein
VSHVPPLGRTPRAALLGAALILLLTACATAPPPPPPDAEQLLCDALARGDRAQALELILDGADPRIPCTRGRTPLHLAAAAGDADLVRLLLQQGADPDALDEERSTPLHLAVSAGHVEAARALLDAGANADAVNVAGKTPLGLANEQGLQELALAMHLARRARAARRKEHRFAELQTDLYARGRYGRFNRLRPPPRNAPASPEQQELIEQLDAIGYAAGTQEAPDLEGVTRHDRNRAWPGINLVISGHAPEAFLIDMEGRVVHRWGSWYWRDHMEIPSARAKAGRFWRRALPLENGDLLAIHERLGLLRLDRNSNVLWALPNYAHHEVQELPNGDLVMLACTVRLIPEIHPTVPVVDELITRVSADGHTLDIFSIFDCILAADTPLQWVRELLWGKSGDALHANTLFVLDRSLEHLAPEFKQGRILTSFRNIDTIALIDPVQRKLVWAYKGDFRQQHDPRILPNDHLLLFDNQGRPGRSSVQEYDLRNMTLTWIFRGTETNPFYSHTCGAARRLPNGNTLIAETDNGRAFELTPQGEIVWEFYNPFRAGENDEYIASLFDLVRLPSDFAQGWARFPQGGPPLTEIARTSSSAP